MTEVILHIYDVTNSGSDKTNNTIVHINKIFEDGIGLGGIFHSAVQVYGDEEWSFGFCEQGTGVFSCPTGKKKSDVNQILRELSREWPGHSYDLLAKNCNHFCEEFCERLGVPKLPGWVNRFANAGDAALEVAENTADGRHGKAWGVAHIDATGELYFDDNKFNNIYYNGKLIPGKINVK
ncbi:hypothetical protein QQ045_003803 [Rhodiola kirilowii]